MEDSLHQTLEMHALSSSEPLQSSACDVCQGLFDKESPRGFVLELDPGEIRVLNFRQPDYFDHMRYVYTYIHHTDLGSLLASAEAGCRICTIISNQMEHGSPGPAAKCSPAQNSARPIAGAKATRPNEDFLTATKLAELGKRERLHDLTRLGIHSMGRIFLQSISKGESQGWFYGQNEAEIHRLTDISAPTRAGLLYHFHTPCRSDCYPEKMCCRDLTLESQMTILTPNWSTDHPQISCQSHILL